MSIKDKINSLQKNVFVRIFIGSISWLVIYNTTFWVLRYLTNRDIHKTGLLIIVPTVGAFLTVGATTQMFKWKTTHTFIVLFLVGLVLSFADALSIGSFGVFLFLTAIVFAAKTSKFFKPGAKN